MTSQVADPPNANPPAHTAPASLTRWPEVALGLLIGAAAINHYSIKVFGLNVYPENIALALCLALIAFAAWRGMTRLYLPSGMWLLGGWLTIALLASVMNAPDKIHSVILWNKLLLAVLTYAVAANLTRGRSVKAITMQCFVTLSAALFGLFVQMMWEFNRIDLGTQPAPNGARVVYATLWEPDIFGSYTMAASLLAFVLLSARSQIPTRRLRTLSWLTVIACAPALVVSVSRSAWLAFLVSLTAATLVAFSRLCWSWKIRSGLIVSCLLAVLLILGLQLIVPRLDPYNGPLLARRLASFIDLRGDSPLWLRIQVTSNALTVWIQHPWIGWGVGAYGDMFHMPYSNRTGWISNLFIHHLFDTGALGLGAFVSGVSLVAWRGLRVWHSAQGFRQSVLAGLLLALLGLLIAFQATEASWLAFPWIYLGMLEGATGESETRD